MSGYKISLEKMHEYLTLFYPFCLAAEQSSLTLKCAVKILQLNTHACSHPSACCFWPHLLQDQGQCVKTICRDSKLLVLSQGENNLLCLTTSQQKTTLLHFFTLLSAMERCCACLF